VLPDSAEEFRTIWLSPEDDSVVQIIDQRLLPHDFRIHNLYTWMDGVEAISDMYVRGAPLIGATAAWSLYLATLQSGDVDTAAQALLKSRPTAVNLHWAVNRVTKRLQAAKNAKQEAIATKKRGDTVNILTHCNAGSLATINWGTATAPIYFAHRKGIKVHVWVDETRPRNQGSQLTTWELAANHVPHTLIVDNAGGHLMQHGEVDLVITGTDRTTRCGDVANKIGTYLKALAAFDNDIPFYVALPSTTIDWESRDGIAEIPIEERDASEVINVYGVGDSGTTHVRTVAAGTAVSNFAFDVTPARLVTGLITERGICKASEAGLLSLFPERHGA